jgi:O-methyltransferase involved in polyketide biosynthesis
MTIKIHQSLEGVSETLLITLLARARESQRPDGMIHDETALAMVKQLDVDFSRLFMQRHDEVAVIIRMRKFDNFVRQFMTRNLQAAVVHIGCGLDTRFERVDDGRIEWFDLDMPEVMALRQKLLHISNSRYHTLSTSVFEETWLEEVARCQPRAFLFIAEGVLPYFEEAQVKGLFLRLRARFPGCELVSDVHTPFVVWADNIHLALSKVKARMHWSVKQPSDVEGWAEGIRLLEAWNYMDDETANLKAFRIMRMIPGLAKASGICHYRLGGPA